MGKVVGILIHRWLVFNSQWRQLFFCWFWNPSMSILYKNARDVRFLLFRKNAIVYLAVSLTEVPWWWEYGSYIVWPCGLHLGGMILGNVCLSTGCTYLDRGVPTLAGGGGGYLPWPWGVPTLGRRVPTLDRGYLLWMGHGMNSEHSVVIT